jgi:hypothetical protein
MDRFAVAGIGLPRLFGKFLSAKVAIPTLIILGVIRQRI